MALRGKCEITASILKSGVKSLNDYVRITDGDSGVFYTPEYWYTVSMFGGIKSDTKYFPLLENTIEELREYSGKIRRGKVPDNLRRGGKTDIGIWTKKWDPIAMVEVKRGWSWDNKRFKPDIERITSALQNLGGKKRKSKALKWGFFVVVSDRWDKGREECIQYFEDNFANFNERTQSILDNQKVGAFKLSSDYACTRYDTENKRMSAVYVFRISR